ncbi:uncharacterized protein LOC122091146 isoform X2 [Macadamia integrifolia]|uniref:uncharacterized protein LOC122091146 isoform X2 n=1 Tax=Macadamia integrifolia TaxID=60698 RepID=UPI001C4F02B5|nr:uncharacterized protein LOC122091146 isoform X2 [Macadamia integrifolia]
MAISDQESLPDKGDKIDSFVVDIERLSHVTDKDISPNSRITRSFSRKGSHRGERKNSIAMATSQDKAIDTVPTNGDSSSKGGGGFSTGENSITVPLMVNPVAEAMNKQAQVMMMMNSEGRFSRRLSGKRPPAWLVGPRTVFVFFATLSSMGTILLIYFTLSMSKLAEDDLSGAQLLQ